MVSNLISGQSSKTPKQAVLNLFTSVMHRGSWREKGATPEHWMDVDLYRFFAKTAERGKLHSLFIADTSSLVYATGEDASILSRSAWMLRPEPFTLGAYLAGITDHIGIAVTASTTYTHPYNIARQLAMLDHVSGGRAGWNIVTSHMAGETANFGLDKLLDHSVRYQRASEYVDVVKGLLDSWDDDAFPRDQESGVYADATKMHRLHHDGEFFKVAGPLNVSRSPQGYPVFAQAGSSPDGRSFAAEVAEMMFTFQSDIERARAFYTEMKELTGEVGRDPNEIKILPALELVVEETDERAQEKLDELNSLVDPAIALNLLSEALYFDLSTYPIDGPLPEIPLNTERAQTRQRMLVDEARRDNLTIRQLAQRLGTGDSGAIAGSPTTIADRIEEWVSTGACDGFNLTFPNPVRSLTNFVDLVVPELQRRGIFHEDYTGKTLRENLGLARPADRGTRDSASATVG